MIGRLLAITTGLCLVGAMTMSSGTPAGGRHSDSSPAARLSSRPVAEKPGWRELIVHADGPHVTPAAVTVEGATAEVTNPDGLRQPGGGVTTLRTSGPGTATVVVDLGRVAMGTTELVVKSSTGAPVRVSYAQFRQFLGPEGDGMGAPFGTDAHPWSRVDVFEPSAETTTLRSPGKREARYVAITLDGPGEVVIDAVRVRQTIYPIEYDGSFLSSDDLLNQAWYHSAYTGDLATVTENGSPWMLTVTFDRVLFMADLHLQALAGYHQSSDYRWLMRNTLRQYGCVQNPDGSLPTASSHLVTCTPGDPGPADGWRVPDEGPDPDSVIGFAGPYSIYRDITIDSFTAFWVAGLADYYRYSGDAAFVREQLPVARRAVAFLTGRTTDDGLFYEPEDRRADPDAAVPWVANWSPGDVATGVDALTNAVFYDALEGLAVLEDEVGRQRHAAAGYRTQAQDLRQALIARLWDPAAGAMVLNDSDPRRDHTGDANAGNLLFRTLDPDQAQAAMAFLDTVLDTPHGTLSSEHADNPYRASNIQGYVNAMEALGRVRYGDGQGAVDHIRGWWGHMLRHGPGTGWFAWNNDGTVDRGAFANTAWTTALPALSEGVLGISPTAAGFRRWAVAPQPADLQWAQGRVPVPGGSISSRWDRRDGGFVLTVDAPRRGIGEVAVPLLGADREIALDGRVVWRGGRPVGGVHATRRGDAVVFSGIRGNHTFAWAATGR